MDNKTERRSAKSAARKGLKDITQKFATVARTDAYLKGPRITCWPLYSNSFPWQNANRAKILPSDGTIFMARSPFRDVLVGDERKRHRCAIFPGALDNLLGANAILDPASRPVRTLIRPRQTF